MPVLFNPAQRVSDTQRDANYLQWGAKSALVGVPMIANGSPVIFEKVSDALERTPVIANGAPMINNGVPDALVGS